jgi:hypothetical protein
MKKIILIGFVFLMGILILVSCGNTPKDDVSNATNTQSNITIPSTVQYDIVRDEHTNIKRVVEVVLNKRVNKKVLKDIGLKIRQGNEKTYIGYFLGKQNVGYGYWARTNFIPYLEVKISGATLEQEQALRKKEESNPKRKVIGSWLSDINPYNPVLVKLTFYKDDNNATFLERTYANGNQSTTRMSAKNDPVFGLKIYEYKYYKRDGKYYLITPERTLELWNNEGGNFAKPEKL